MFLKKDIGKQIKQRREALNIEQSDLADLSDIAESTISKIENGKANPTLATLEKLLIPLGLTLQTQIKQRG